MPVVLFLAFLLGTGFGVLASRITLSVGSISAGRAEKLHPRQFRTRSIMFALLCGMGFAVIAVWCQGYPAGCLQPALACWCAQALRVLGWWALYALSIVLSVIDIEHLRLPQRVLTPGAALILLSFGHSALFSMQWEELVHMLTGGFGMWGFFALLHHCAPQSLGQGDVALSRVLGAVLGYCGFIELLLGLAVTSCLACIGALVLQCCTPAGHPRYLAFGPLMFAGAWISVLWWQPVSEWWLTVLKQW